MGDEGTPGIYCDIAMGNEGTPGIYCDIAIEDESIPGMYQDITMGDEAILGFYLPGHSYYFLRINLTEKNLCQIGNQTHDLDTNCLAHRSS